MKITDYLEQNFNFDKSISDGWNPYVEKWKSWYTGTVKDFHFFSIYNGKSRVKCKKLSLQMAVKACNDWADALFNERVKIELPNETANAKLFDILEHLDFWQFMNSAVERSGATGTGAIVVSVGNVTIDEQGKATFDGAETNIDYVDVQNIYPISWSNGKISECAFAVKKLIKGQFYVLLSIHHYADSGNMVITNKIFRMNNTTQDLTELDSGAMEDMNIIEEFDTGSNIPWFAIVKPAGTNNINPDLPFGMPYFAQSIDVLMRIDETWDSMQNEIKLGRKRIFVREDMTTVDTATGEQQMVFDTNDISVYILPKGFDSKELLQSDNTELRVEALRNDLETSLAIFGDKVGFGVQYYQLDPAGQVREIGILTQNSKMVRRKIKHEVVLESAVHDILSAVLYANGMSNDGLKITFDNNIIDDENQRKQTALMEVSQGIMSKAEYREEFYGEDPKVAQQKVAAATQELEPSFEPSVMGD